MNKSNRGAFTIIEIICSRVTKPKIMENSKKRLSVDIPVRHIVIVSSSAELQILNEDAHEAKSISVAKEVAMQLILSNLKPRN